MIEGLPIWIEIVFAVTFCLALVLFYYANGRPKALMGLILGWSCLQSVLAFSGFYLMTDTMPPRFGLVLIPGILIIIYGVQPRPMNEVRVNRNTTISTCLHAVRLPIEIVLFGLFTNKMIPQLMTFEGRNFDILIGITAPIMGWLFWQNKMSKQVLLVWNVIGLGFVLFILVNAILSAELPFQQFAFDQPNRAVNYFPFVLLPGVIVPMVIYTHLSDMIIISKEIRQTSPN